MKLYVTAGSPYARIARIVILEKGLQDRIEILDAVTRTPDSPYYAINPSGRVPCLILDNGIIHEDSSHVCRYLDHLDGRPRFEPPDDEEGWELRRIEAQARSMLDGLAVWMRELRRPENERSPTIIAHETARACRMADLFENQMAHPAFRSPLNMPQIVVAAALHGREDSLPAFHWREGRPLLAAWIDRIGERPSVAATLPPTRS